METHRQLAAIMFTDIVGYTAMMQVNEEDTLTKVEHYKQVQKEIIQQYKGDTIKYYGDGSLTIFTSVLDAVNCALEIQQTLQKSPKVPLRIGIHTGDVIHSDEDVYGDSINIASRLQAFGEEGSIIFSRDVYNKIKNHPELKSVFLGKHKLKNVLSEIKIYALSNSGLTVPSKSSVEDIRQPVQKRKLKSLSSKIKSLASYGLVAVMLLIVIAFTAYKIQERQKKQLAINNVLPNLISKSKTIDESVGARNWEVYLKCVEFRKALKNNPEFIQLWNDITYPLFINTNYDGAKVFAKPYSNPDTSWYFLGITPLENYSFPKGLSRIKIEKPGLETQYDVLLKFLFSSEADTLNYRLFKPEEIPEGMVYVPGQHGNYWNTPTLPETYIDHFWMDRFEITNEEFKIFIDSGGYENSSYWNFPFIDDGDTLTFEAAIANYKDKTGWTGPANWELSDYPDGSGKMPVTGISWYEASAYAEFKGKALPTLYHWLCPSLSLVAPEIIKFGNFDKESKKPAGVYNSMTKYGIYDLPGNVSEWTYNANLSKKYIMGGNYQEPSYLYNATFIQSPPMERSELVGFRCIKYINDSLQMQLRQNFDIEKRDYDNLRPVSDEIFQVYKEMLQFERNEVNPVLLSTSETAFFTKEIIKVDASYGGAPLKIFIFLPKNYNPPFQTILYFPGLDAHQSNDINDLKVNFSIDFLLKSGRAVIWPVYFATYGRGSTNISNTILWKEAYRNILQDVQVTLDYLKTRPDLDFDKTAYFGVSWGGSIAPFILAIENRIKIGITALFGVSSMKKYRFKEFDTVDYLPRVKIPMLLLGGQYDFDYTMQEQQVFCDLLGTPETDKRWKTYESTHYIPRSPLINESLSWLDKYFGPVEK